MTAFTVEIQDGVARLVMDVPNQLVNTISAVVGAELYALLSQLRGDDSVRAVVFLSGKPDNFIAGADIEEFAALKSRDAALELVQAGQDLVNQLETLGKPVIAAIHGTCLGGGLEAVLACAYRIATSDPKTKLGLPEVQLGIIPAAGGCQRLPRLIGARAALDMILAAKIVPAKRALRIGIIDEMVHPAILEEVAIGAANRLADGWKPRRRRSGAASLLLDRNPFGRRIVFSTAAKQVRKRTHGNYPAPLAALDAVRHGLKRGMRSGLKREAQHFAELAVGDVSRQLVQVFFATTALKKDPGVTGSSPAGRPVSNLALVGSGFMGAGIGGTAVLRAGVDVRFRDTDLGRVAQGLATSQKILRDRFKRRQMTKFAHRRLSALISGGTDWSGFGRADVVIEAVFEDIDVKREVFADLETQVTDDCVLASNTSSIPIARIAEGMRRPERVLGMHFFSPVEKMPLLEVIVTERTASWAIVTAVKFGRRMGKTVIVVMDRPGFWVNRILSPYVNEAGRLLHEGVSVEEIDRAMRRFGFPVGPITLLDEVGLDVAQKAGNVMFEAFGERLSPLPGLAAMIDAGRLGRKNSRGFYLYDKHGKKNGVDSSAYEVFGIEPRPVPDADIERRLVFAMLNEAARAFEQQVVRNARDGDIGAIFGIGYPPFRGGPLRQLDELGPAHAVETLKRLQQAYGDRFEPAAALRAMAKTNQRFYADG